MERQLKQNLLKILNIINDHKEHIPSITTTDGNPFPYQVSDGCSDFFVIVFDIRMGIINIYLHTHLHRLLF